LVIIGKMFSGVAFIGSVREAATQRAGVAEVARGAPAAGRTDVECDADDLVSQGLVHPFSVLTEDQSLRVSLVLLVGMGSCAEKTSDCGRSLVGTKGGRKRLLVAPRPKGIVLGSTVGAAPPAPHARITTTA
jgi:hypothetical protein